MDRQEELFREHASLSRIYGKPMIIHNVRGTDRLVRLRRELRPAERGSSMDSEESLSWRDSWSERASTCRWGRGSTGIRWRKYLRSVCCWRATTLRWMSGR